MAHLFPRIALIASILILAAADRALTVEPPAVPSPPTNKPVVQPPAKAAVAVTISKETTYITEPLRKDGYVDYVAALDRKCREGITPENNAAVLFWQAIGPAHLSEKIRESYFRRLGMAHPPEKGDYFVNFEEFLAAKKVRSKREDEKKARLQPDQDLYDMLKPLKRRPWSKTEFPVIAEWLAANEKPLALVIEASKRPRFYDLQIQGGKAPMIAVQSPSMDCLHHPGDIVSALIVRAMSRLREGNRKKAWDDLLACHRLARLIGQGPTIAEALARPGRTRRHARPTRRSCNTFILRQPRRPRCEPTSNGCPHATVWREDRLGRAICVSRSRGDVRPRRKGVD